MAKEITCRVARVATHQLNYGTCPIVTKVTIEIGKDKDDDSCQEPSAELDVEYAGQPRHKVGQTIAGLADIFMKVGL